MERKVPQNTCRGMCFTNENAAVGYIESKHSFKQWRTCAQPAGHECQLIPCSGWCKDLAFPLFLMTRKGDLYVCALCDVRSRSVF